MNNTLTDDDIKEFLKFYKNKVPNINQEPRRFAFYLKMWKYYKNRKKTEVVKV